MISVNNKANTERKTRIFVFSNQNGGVGKTTTAVSLAAGLSKNGYKTLLIDMDPQGNATSGVGVDKRAQEKTIYDCFYGIQLYEAVVKTAFENLYLVPSNSALAGSELELKEVPEREFVLSKLIKSLNGAYDFVLIDCPPSLGLLTINSLVAAEKLIIPLQCEYYSLEGLGDLLNTYNLIKEKLNPKLEIGGVILTMADFRANSTMQVIEEVQGYFNEKVFQSVVSRSVRVAEAPSHGKPIVHYDPSSKGTSAYLDIVDELLVREGLKENFAEQNEEEEVQKTDLAEEFLTEPQPYIKEKLENEECKNSTGEVM